MRTEKEIRDMRQFVSFFNDGKIINESYVGGLRDAFDFVLYSGGHLERYKKELEELLCRKR